MFTQAASERRVLNNIQKIHKILQCAMTGVVVVVGIFYVFFTLLPMPGTGMQPTKYAGDTLVVLRPYWYHQPELGDVVVINLDQQIAVSMVKRITGMPGSTVDFQGQNVVLGADQYFVTGDNALESIDSRQIGIITRAQIVSKVLNVR